MICIGDSVPAKKLVLEEVDGKAKQLWDELKRICTISSTQAIGNLQVKLEALLFKEGDEWEKNV